MNRNLIVIVALVIFLVGVAAVYMMNKSKEDKAKKVAVVAMDEDSLVTDDNQSVSGSFLDLLALGKSYQCTFETTDNSGTQTSGMVYVAETGDKLKGEFKISSTDGTTYDAYVLRDGSYNYLWSSQQPQGFKTQVLESEELFNTNSEENSIGVGDLDGEVEFDCNKWKVDNSIFVAPSDIEFTDFSQMMQQATEEIKESSSLDCSVCDQVPEGQAKTQCLTNLGC